MRTPLCTVELLYSNTLRSPSVQNSSIPKPWNEDTFCIQQNSSIPTPLGHPLYSGTPLFQHPEMRTLLYTVEPLYSNTLKWGHLCIQWNSSIPTPWNEDTSVYSGTPLFQHPEMRTPLYTVELLYSNTLKWGHPLYSGTSLFQHPEMRTPLYTVEPAKSSVVWTLWYVPITVCVLMNFTPWNEATLSNDLSSGIWNRAAPLHCIPRQKH